MVRDGLYKTCNEQFNAINKRHIAISQFLSALSFGKLNLMNLRADGVEATEAKFDPVNKIPGLRLSCLFVRIESITLDIKLVLRENCNPYRNYACFDRYFKITLLWKMIRLSWNNSSKKPTYGIKISVVQAGLSNCSKHAKYMKIRELFDLIQFWCDFGVFKTSCFRFLINVSSKRW